MSIAAPRTPPAPLAAALLDLDGTLVDTAPDMLQAINLLLAERHCAPLDLPTLRPHVSHGSSAVVRCAFPQVDATTFDTLRARFLQLYADTLADQTRLFAGFEAVLDAFETHRVPWGIVTNKPAWLTDPLLLALGLRSRVGCVISGDTLPQRKPDPAPLLAAAQALRLAPEQCLYLGDALRDAQAAQAAGMVALGARYGYIGPQERPETWPVRAWIDEPMQLLAWVGLPAPRGGAPRVLAAAEG